MTLVKNSRKYGVDVFDDLLTDWACVLPVLSASRSPGGHAILFDFVSASDTAGRRYVFTSARGNANAPAEVAGEEPSRTVALVVGHRIVPARVGVQRLLLRAEGIEQRHP